MKYVVSLALLVAVAACGGSSSSPTTPSGNSTPSNRNPSVTSMSVTPSFGIQDLTTFSYTASASDPDGDSVTFAWDVAGNSASGSSGTIRFSTGGSGTARVTVSDGHGGSASDTRTFVVGSMTGTWSGSFDGWYFTSNLQQSGGRVTGDYSDQAGPGKLDPASVNTIDANGNVELRYKSGKWSDFYFRGTMDATGRKITGGVYGSGYTGQPFTMSK